MVAAAVIGAVGAVGGAYIASQGAQSAAQTQANAATANQQAILSTGQQAANIDQQAIGAANAPFQPFLNLGSAGAAGLNNLITGQNSGQMTAALQNIPGYQFQLQQGLEATQNGFAAKGLGSSGAAMKGAANYAEGLANSNYQNFFNNDLSATQLGANAASNVSQNIANLNIARANALTGAATNSASLGMAGAASTAAGQAAAANALGNGISNAGNLAAQYAMMNGMYGSSGASPQLLAAANASNDPLGTLMNGLTG